MKTGVACFAFHRKLSCILLSIDRKERYLNMKPSSVSIFFCDSQNDSVAFQSVFDDTVKGVRSLHINPGAQGEELARCL